ncbi:MAG: hypothetical protein JWN34_1232, partial [Bryobacterales bacterium]|nr:hypothetical protein [Bryobacterales bacterium]
MNYESILDDLRLRLANVHEAIAALERLHIMISRRRRPPKRSIEAMVFKRRKAP